MPQSTWWARSSWALVSKALHPSSAARTPSAIVLTFGAAPPCDFQPGEEGAPGSSTGVDLRPVAMAEAHPGLAHYKPDLPGDSPAPAHAAKRKRSAGGQGARGE